MWSEGPPTAVKGEHFPTVQVTTLIKSREPAHYSEFLIDNVANLSFVIEKHLIKVVVRKNCRSLIVSAFPLIACLQPIALTIGMLQLGWKHTPHALTACEERPAESYDMHITLSEESAGG